MDPTKQYARKSTGGMAPRKRLPGKAELDSAGDAELDGVVDAAKSAKRAKRAKSSARKTAVSIMTYFSFIPSMYNLTCMQADLDTAKAVRAAANAAKSALKSAKAAARAAARLPRLLPNCRLVKLL